MNIKKTLRKHYCKTVLIQKRFFSKAFSVPVFKGGTLWIYNLKTFLQNILDLCNSFSQTFICFLRTLRIRKTRIFAIILDFRAVFAGTKSIFAQFSQTFIKN